MLRSGVGRTGGRFCFLAITSENMLKTLQKAHNAFRSGLSLIFPLFLLSFPDQHMVSMLADKAEAGGPETAAVQTIASQSTVDIILAVTEKIPEKESQTVQQVLLGVCESRGYGEECGKTLLGMLWKESLNNPRAVGDQGRSHGYFQIQTKLHKVPLECTQDLVCSANWTIDYLEQHGYPKYVAYAVQCHNGCLIGNGYAASALRHGARLWDSPLPIVVTLAAK